MPSSKIISVKRSGVETVLGYLMDKTAESHQEYQLTPLRFHGVESTSVFAQVCEQGIQANLERSIFGRKSENAAYWYIVRFPDGSRLRPSERRYCMRALLHEAELGGLPAVGNEHRNRIFGSQDFNLLTPAFDKLGLPSRSALLHPVRELRTRMDEVASILNAHRRAADQDAIFEMAVIRRQRARKLPDVVEMLGALPKPPANPDELLAALWSIGWEAEWSNQRKKRLRIRKDKQAPQREMDAEGLLTLVVRWRLARFHEIQVAEKLAASELKPKPSAEKIISRPKNKRTMGLPGQNDQESPPLS